MIYEGTFGYIIGKKRRMMYVKTDANLLWQILVREIYVLMKHYKTKEALQEAFETIKTTKTKPKPKKEDKERYKIFTDLEAIEDMPDDWHNILHYCQGSYINILVSGYTVNQSKEIGQIFMLDFNKGIARFYTTDLSGKTKELNIATIDEIMSFDDMPINSYTEIITEMNNRFAEFYEKYLKVQEEIDKIKVIISEAKKQCSFNIEKKATQLLDSMLWERKKLILERRVFYHRLKVLDLIDESQ
jgi:hypothetical protein